MTTPYRPLIRTQADLEQAWRHLVRPLGFHRRSLWMLLIDGDERPTPVMTEITDLPEAPEAGQVEGLAQLLAHFVTDVKPTGRWALLFSRPGDHTADATDLTWAAALYAMLRGHSIPHHPLHLATDQAIVPIPLDDVTDYLRAS
jgi:hypothetical protein